MVAVYCFKTHPLRRLTLIRKQKCIVHIAYRFILHFNLQQNGHLSFVPEDYGKERAQITPVSSAPPTKRTRTSGNSNSSTTPNSAVSNDTADNAEEPLPVGQLKCEFCHVVGRADTFLPPSRRFCSLTCCKRYSAEKRYYPYGRDEEGIAKSIQEGLLNPKSRYLRPGANKQVRFEVENFLFCILRLVFELWCV